jgi:hypothetical protein
MTDIQQRIHQSTVANSLHVSVAPFLQKKSYYGGDLALAVLEDLGFRGPEGSFMICGSRSDGEWQTRTEVSPVSLRSTNPSIPPSFFEDTSAISMIQQESIFGANHMDTRVGTYNAS